MKSICLAVLSIALVSCNHSPAPTPTAADAKMDQQAHSPATISANPNPVPPGNKMGATTISWNTGSDESGEVYVSTDSRPEQLVATGASGSKTVKWIQPKHHYDFRLYDGNAHQKVLGEVKVTQQG